MSPEKDRTVTGDLRFHDFPSTALCATRQVAVWLPPGYQTEAAARYPVLYLQDGQNLFDRATSFGDEWEVDETATALIVRGEIVPVIVVGIYNAGEGRIDEYTPAATPDAGVGRYGRMLVTELKPWIDATYRTQPHAGATGIGGSSMGALAALHVALAHPHTFGLLAAMSPSVWWSERAILRAVAALPGHLPIRIWLDAGTAEAPEVVPDVRALRDAFVGRGWRIGRDLAYTEAPGAGHDERAWAARVGPMLRYLLPAPRRGRDSAARALKRVRDLWRR